MGVIRLVVMLAVALGAAVSASASPYLGPQQVQLTLLLPPPPDDTGPDMQEVLAQQQARTPARVALAIADAQESVFAMYGAVLGPSFAPATLPLTARLFQRIGETEEVTVDPVKRLFGRPRPFMANAAVHPELPPSRSFSYPSGHSTRSTLHAIVLASMLPEQRGPIFRRQGEYAQSRIIGGMHYPSDIAAGTRAGTAIAAVLLNDPAFQADFAPARRELRAALGLAE